MDKKYLNTICDLLSAVHTNDDTEIINCCEKLITLVTDNVYPSYDESCVCYDLACQLEDELNTDWQDDEESVD